ncbi:hypothetical protein V8G54_006217 [Vigna mungo]|uniref:Uncharacterized protein n=1 Tax=Vigna mungo TaxID=3915 RepID=A0AAQ3P0S6_VIGMU
MAHESDLVKIGMEGFDLIDRFYGAQLRRGSNVKQRQNHKEESAVINSKEAASKFGGIMVVNYFPKTKPQNRWEILRSSSGFFILECYVCNILLRALISIISIVNV